MKKIIVLSIFSLFLLTSYSQEKSSMWLTNIDQAIAQSMETEKPIMLFFTGSDWCGWCKRLVKEVFDQKEFKDWAKDKIIPVELDFPRRTKLDENLIHKIVNYKGYLLYKDIQQYGLSDLSTKKKTK